MRSLTIGFFLILVMSLATSAWADCAGGPEMTAKAQMACCKGGHKHCPMAGTPADCCGMNGQNIQQISVATHEANRVVVTPPTLTATLASIAVVPTMARVSVIEYLRVAPQASPPPHLLAPILLI